MATYLRLAPFFKAGCFYGLDEMTHLHVHPTKSAAIVNCFNLEDRQLDRVIEFIPQKFNLDPTRSYLFNGLAAPTSPGAYAVPVSLPAQSHRLIEIIPVEKS
jgi:hypothetical protein